MAYLLFGQKLKMTFKYINNILVPVTEIKLYNTKYYKSEISFIPKKKQKIIYKLQVSKPSINFFNQKKEHNILNALNLTFQDYILQPTINNILLNTLLNVTSNSIGKGYTSVIKKHNFKRGPMSHGSKHHRLSGSLGAGTTPSRVFPGKKMSGRLGNTKHTMLNLVCIEKNLINNSIYIKGSIPGKKNNLLFLKNYD